MIVYRIVNLKHAADISGVGAALYPGRWNQKGSPVLYAGATKEIALLENIVHIPPLIIPKLDILTIEIPDDSITELIATDLPPNWSQYPSPAILAEIGEQWILEAKTIALKVPSSIIHSSINYILNCNHKDYARVKLLEHIHFPFDLRLKS